MDKEKKQNQSKDTSTLTIINRIKKDTNNATDIIYKEISIDNQNITLVYSEVLTSGMNISNLILKNIAKIIDEKIKINSDLYTFFYNSLLAIT